MQRDSYFDNYKGFLIILVLVGHFISPLIEKNHLANFIETSIYFFHMPTFIFISAYFSRKNQLSKLVKTLFIPYTVFQFIYYIFQIFIWRRDFNFEFFHPDFSLWFILSLFWWRILINEVLKVKHILIILFALGILIGFDTSIGTFFSLERTVYFFPFFILGYHFDKDKFMTYANKRSVQIMSVLLLVIIFTVNYFFCDYLTFDLLTAKYSYQKIGLPNWGWLNRAVLYALSTLMIYLFAVIIPRKKHWYSYLGLRTLSIYLLHGLIYRTFEFITNIYDIINTDFEVMLMVLFSIVLAFILSTKPFDYLVKLITQIPVEKLLIKNKEN
jgi:fucose 4-O-acetylase-like acetyltransferase